MRGLNHRHGARRFLLLKEAPFTVDVGGWEHLVEIEEPEIIARRLVAKAIGCPYGTTVILDSEISWVGLDQQLYHAGFDSAPGLGTWPIARKLVEDGIARDLGPAPDDDTFTMPKRVAEHKSLYPPGQF
jgi:hypothetical protein